ncbi:MAG: SRPBCC family protein [Desulfobacterales bacterium]|nr:SRPBCC family protein [Desulfobacterales bacterium]
MIVENLSVVNKAAVWTGKEFTPRGRGFPGQSKATLIHEKNIVKHFKIAFVRLRRWAACLVAVTLVGCATAPVPERLQFLEYQGSVNEHDIFIQAPPSRIFALLTDFDRFPALLPSDRIQMTKVSPEPYRIGTVIRTQTRYRISLRWNTQVVAKQADRRLVLQFLDGIFRDGYEIWELRQEGTGTRVSHAIVYNIANFLYHTFWVLKRVESRHDALIEDTLLNLKQACEAEPTPAAPNQMQEEAGL